MCLYVIYMRARCHCEGSTLSAHIRGFRRSNNRIYLNGGLGGHNSFKSFAKLKYNFEVSEYGEGVFERERRKRKKSV